MCVFCSRPWVVCEARVSRIVGAHLPVPQVQSLVLRNRCGGWGVGTYTVSQQAVQDPQGSLSKWWECRHLASTMECCLRFIQPGVHSAPKATIGIQERFSKNDIPPLHVLLLLNFKIGSQ